MTYKLALTGAGGTGKTWAVTEAADALREKGLSVEVIWSPTRRVKNLGYELNQGGSWQTQLLSAIFRLEQQKLALQEKSDVILADRCLFDEQAYTLEKLNRPLTDVPLLGEEADNLSMTGALTNALLMQDLTEYWDVICYKPIHPDYAMEADGDRTADSEYQKTIDTWIKWQFQGLDKLGKTPVELPQDRDDAAAWIVGTVLNAVK